VWGLEQTELAAITFEENNQVCGTLPSLNAAGKLQVVIKCRSAVGDDIVWHEGAHVYLFDRRYPPGWFDMTPDPLLGSPVDFVNEYLATKLEIERRFPTQQERLAVVRDRMDRALERLLPRTMAPQAGAGKLPISAAMCAGIARPWTSSLALEAAERFERTSPKLKTIYWAVSDAIKQTPPIAFGSPRLSDQTVETIKALVSASFHRVYGDARPIQFTPPTQPAGAAQT
jgi:hypothetical protein